MVIFCAVGGRMSLIGAVYGTLLVSYGETMLSEWLPALWYFFIGALFILVTLVFTEGLAGIVQRYVFPLFGKSKDKPKGADGDAGSGDDIPADDTEPTEPKPSLPTAS